MESKGESKYDDAEDKCKGEKDEPVAAKEDDVDILQKVFDFYYEDEELENILQRFAFDHARYPACARNRENAGQIATARSLSRGRVLFVVAVCVVVSSLDGIDTMCDTGTLQAASFDDACRKSGADSRVVFRLWHLSRSRSRSRSLSLSLTRTHTVLRVVMRAQASTRSSTPRSTSSFEFARQRLAGGIVTPVVCGFRTCLLSAARVCKGNHTNTKRPKNPRHSSSAN